MKKKKTRKKSKNISDFEGFTAFGIIYSGKNYLGQKLRSGFLAIIMISKTRLVNPSKQRYTLSRKVIHTLLQRI